ncbi:MAG: NAD(P)-binding domain-containing protein [Alistipes putredinis]|nr:MAG: NAD(P)-binding domain-containing protein [Alistipes putredinis]
MTDICIIGSGNVAGALALRIAEIEELHLVGIAARNERQGRSVAQSARCEWSWPEIPAAELYIAAVKDDAIGEVCSLAGIAAEATVVHTSGCVAVDEIGRKNAGVIYPLQSFSAKACTDWNAVPLFIEWTSERARKTVERTASLLSPERAAARLGSKSQTAPRRRYGQQLHQPDVCGLRTHNERCGTSVRASYADDRGFRPENGGGSVAGRDSKRTGRARRRLYTGQASCAAARKLS